ncbi:MAG: class I SAM-dependent methyltransferase, partial [Gammaproteobacteria bacterium]|nr:class I SAM-dependent methyltransferase [Gammaproteobacteria bacterium]
MKPSSIMLPRVPVRPGGVERDIFRNQLVKRLAGIAVGRLQIVQDAQVILDAGDQTETPLVVRIKQSRAYRQMVLGGPIGAAEAYMAGDWETDDLVGVLRLFLANRSVLEALDGGWNLLQKPLRRLHHFLNRDTIAQSKKNIAAHYDLGNDFFSLFLDPTMSYSGGVFVNPEDSMEQASINKFDAICRKLDLKPSDEVIEIGTGWGGFAMYAAEHYGCHVTTTTISEEQFAYADEEITRRGLKGRITLLKDDYRQLRGQYDKLVSIEMIEAVGLAYLPLFFQTCSRLLRPSGSLLIQAITIAESRFKAASKSVDFIQKYIFPGGALAS